jgi:ferredoxin-fold anticodon binding domain-containing protein
MLATVYRKGSGFKGFYAGKNRVGVIEKVTDKFIVVCVGPKQYRTFTIAKIEAYKE